ncbi:MAG TPA: histidinol-phosphatase [Trueperaceae bacterium]
MEIGIQPVVYETHMHTPLCRHAEGEPHEYAEVGRQRGLKGITVTCHNPLPDGINSGTRMYPHQFEEYLDLVARTRSRLEGEVDVLLGLEADFLPGLEAWVERQLNSAGFHYVLGSVHPQLEEYWERYWTDDPFAYQLIYFENLALAAESGLYDCLSHPDLVKNITPDAWDYDRVESDVLRSLDRIARTGIAMELNTSGLNKKIREMNPNQRMLRAMREREIPVVVGADAHTPARVADRYLDAYDLLEQAGYSEVSYFLDRERQTLPIDVARRSLEEAQFTTAAD